MATSLQSSEARARDLPEDAIRGKHGRNTSGHWLGKKKVLEKLSDNKSKRDKETGTPPVNVLLHSKGKLYGREGSGKGSSHHTAGSVAS